MNRFLILLTILLVTSCDKNIDVEQLPVDYRFILGKWQQVAYEYSIGGPLLMEEITNGPITHFKDNYKFSTVTFQTQTLNSGSYNIQRDTLKMVYANDAEKIEYTFKMMRSNGKLKLIPLGPNICIEGCSSIYKKQE